MPTIPRTPEDGSASTPDDEPTSDAVSATLDSILQSQPFRTSRQCQNLLTYIVQHSLHGDDASLRERILGVEVFGRSPDYNTSEDPVVRMRAADVRKRLAQFYLANGGLDSVVRITLKPGSYRATFHIDRASWLSPNPDPAPPVSVPEPAPVQSPAEEILPGARHLPHSRYRTRPAWPGLVFILLLAALLGVAAWNAWRSSLQTAQQRFWAPLLQSRQPILIYTGSNAVYRFTPDFMERYRKQHAIDQNGPEFFVDLPHGSSLQADDLVPVKNSFVSVADLAAAVQVVSVLHTWKKPFTLRSAADLSIGDIRNVPSVLIGGFNNRWALLATKDLPFSFQNGLKIENRNDPAHSWTVGAEQSSTSTQDFALISRLQHANTGGPLLTIGGVGSFGTQAAAEFVANPDRMNDLLKSAPAGWETRNMQAVLRIQVVDFAPAAVDVVATSYW